ncbi:RagB/SusD family nutrient uptake outer membrane protein [Halosquirtibacter xylanolyticus]|uniref:RagB/SusD family nutrient uptake outer membrane protein n=1 Tax=Halosquirtibacter xylanolyticus TaxID=3374599 RepID=UPI0037493344|nr:RagB/SusD family nutrient uptake outer membrane protein [Prolixibacteraceae bacterium]
MRKNLAYIFILSFLMISCEKDFLERYPLDKISSADYWTSENDLRLYANKFYQKLPSHGTNYSSGYMFSRDKGTDNLISGKADDRFSGVLVTPSSDGSKWNWSTIRSVNYFIAHCDKVTTGNKASINTYKGEIYFFRAYFYYNLLKKYGDLPWVDKVMTENSQELYNPRVSRNIIANNIVKDLDIAIELLKSRASQKGDDKMRISKEVALLFKSRVCLYEGTWEKYHQGTAFGVDGKDGREFLELVPDVLKQMKMLGTCAIETGDPTNAYWSLFNKSDYTNSKEVLLWRKYDISLGLGHNLNRNLARGNSEGLTKSFIDSFLDIEGNPISASNVFQGYNSLTEIVADRDPRLKQSVWVENTTLTTNHPSGKDEYFDIPLVVASTEDRSITGFNTYKGFNPDYDQRSANHICTTGAIIMRYAEVLLNDAEAKAELGTLTQADVDQTINVLRDRVGMVHLDIANITEDINWQFPKVSDVINEIRRERRIELSLSGYRKDDLMRWRGASSFINKRPLGFKYTGSVYEGKYLDKKGKDMVKLNQNLFLTDEGFIDPFKKILPNGYGFDENRDYLLPLPLDQLNLNNNLKQNPGWES